MAKTIKVKVLNENELEYPDGKRTFSYSTPSQPPPNEDMAWHDALCRWMPKEDVGKQFEAEIEVFDGTEEAKDSLGEFINGQEG